MIARLFLCIGVLLTVSSSYAQTLYVYGVRDYCPGTTATVEFRAEGITLAADNQFTVKLEATGVTVSRDLAVTAVSGYQLRVPFPADIPSGDYRMTLRTSNPALVSPPSLPFWLAPRPTATIRAVQTAPVGPFEPVPIEYTYTGPTGGTIILSDGSIIRLGSYNYSPPQMTRRHLVRAEQSATYRIASVTSEQCGSGTGSGEVPVRISSVGLRLLSALPTQICAGSRFTLGYSASGPFEAGNRFTVQLSQFPGGVVAQFPAEATPDGLTAVIPETVPPSDYYTVSVLADKPAVISNALGTYVAVRRKVAIQLTGGSTSIMWGANAELPLLVTGKDPVDVTLSDGTVLDHRRWRYLYNPNQAFEQRIGYPVSPEQTTTYRVQSFATGCGSGPVTGSHTVLVGPGLKPSNPANLSVCAGVDWKLPVTTRGDLPAGNQFTVRFAYTRTEWPNAVDSLRIPAVLEGSALRFTIPKVSGLTRFRIEGSALASPSDWYELTVREMPRLTMFQLEESYGQKILRLLFSGGAPTTFSLSDGHTYLTPDLPSYYDLPLKGYPTTTFRVLSLSNVCGAGPVPQQAVQYDNPNSVVIRLSDANPKAVCIGTSTDIAFDVVGATAASTYVVQLGSYEYNTNRFVVKQTLGSGSASHIRVNLGTNVPPGAFLIRVVAADPLALSDPEPFAVQTPAVASYYPNGRTAQTITDEQVEYNQQLGVSGGQPFTVTFTDGGAFRKILRFENNSTPFYEFTEPDNYYLESVQNGCGAGTIRSTDTLFVRPFSITTTLAPFGSFCAGGLVNVSYKTEGAVPADAQYTVQLSRRRTGGFYDLPSLASPYPGALLVRLPDTLQHSVSWSGSDLPNNAYYLRVVSKNKDVVRAVPAVQVYVRRPVSAVLTAGGATVYDLERDAVQLRISAKGSPPFWAFLDNRPYSSEELDLNGPGQFTDTYDKAETSFSIPVTPRSKTTYFLRTVYNQCGYGTASGQVTVTTKPKISLRLGSSYATGACAGSLLSLTALASGDFEPGNQVRILLSTSSGTGPVADDRELARYDPAVALREVRLPADLLPGSIFYLRAVGTRPDNVYSNAELIRIVQSATASLQGSTVINAGERTFITLKLSGGEPYQYELSTGQTGTSTQEGSLMLPVQPRETTTYTIRSVRNACGIGQVSGSATVEVLPPSSVTLSLAGSSVTDVCAGAQVRLPVAVSGTVGATPTYRVQLSDLSGLAFADIPTVGEGTSLTATIPVNTPPGETYRLRIRVVGVSTVSSASSYPITVRAPAGSTLSGPPYVELGTPVSLTINLTGTSPWSVVLSDSMQTVRLSAQRSPYVHTVYPNRLTTYRLVSVSNSCGPGTIGTPASVQVGLLTATGPLVHEPIMQLVPNPVSASLTIRYSQPVRVRSVQVINPQGAVLVTVAGSPKAIRTSELPTASWPVGVYLIRCETDQGTWTSRVVKH